MTPFAQAFFARCAQQHMSAEQVKQALDRCHDIIGSSADELDLAWEKQAAGFWNEVGGMVGRGIKGSLGAATGAVGAGMAGLSGAARGGLQLTDKLGLTNPNASWRNDLAQSTSDFGDIAGAGLKDVRDAFRPSVSGYSSHVGDYVTGAANQAEAEGRTSMARGLRGLYSVDRMLAPLPGVGAISSGARAVGLPSSAGKMLAPINQAVGNVTSRVGNALAPAGQVAKNFASRATLPVTKTWAPAGRALSPVGKAVGKYTPAPIRHFAEGIKAHPWRTAGQAALGEYFGEQAGMPTGTGALLGGVAANPAVSGLATGRGVLGTTARVAQGMSGGLQTGGTAGWLADRGLHLAGEAGATDLESLFRDKDFGADYAAYQTLDTLANSNLPPDRLQQQAQKLLANRPDLLEQFNPSDPGALRDLMQQRISDARNNFTQAGSKFGLLGGATLPWTGRLAAPVANAVNQATRHSMWAGIPLAGGAAAVNAIGGREPASLVAPSLPSGDAAGPQADQMASAGPQGTTGQPGAPGATPEPSLTDWLTSPRQTAGRVVGSLVSGETRRAIAQAVPQFQTMLDEKIKTIGPQVLTSILKDERIAPILEQVNKLKSMGAGVDQMANFLGPVVNPIADTLIKSIGKDPTGVNPLFKLLMVIGGGSLLGGVMGGSGLISLLGALLLGGGMLGGFPNLFGKSESNAAPATAAQPAGVPIARGPQAMEHLTSGY